MLFSRTLRQTIQRKMSNLFTQVLNPITGNNEWEIRGADYDYHQEVARAGFGDMLHDTERNQKYYSALRKSISKLHADGKEAHVLDIGTGTGILSMMAVAAGANSVTACEAFMPMAHCAERIINANGMSAKINLIKRRSSELSVGKDGLTRRANILVTEVLDTELIGEGAIGIYNHAHRHLLTDDVICIPAKAICYAQVVQSPLAMQWNKSKLLANLDGEPLLKPPSAFTDCKGESGLHDMQISQIPAHLLEQLIKPVSIFEFDFSSKIPIENKRVSNLKVLSERAGSADMVLFWWDIRMDTEGVITLSCAPYWAHPDFDKLAKKRNEHIPIQNTVPWRDHWMQAIYYIPKPLQLNAPQTEFILSANHDEYSFWFDVWALTNNDEGKTVPRHSCTCNLHMTYSRSRIGQMNQSLRNKQYLRFLEQAIDDQSHVLSIGDGSLLGLATSNLGAASVICYESKRFSRNFIESYVKNNQIKNISIIPNLDEVQSTDLERITHVFAEPYFITSILPWDNFYFGTLLHSIKEKLSPNVRIIPHSAKIFAIPVEFLDLHKIRAPLGTCEGFDLTIFDKMVDISATLADSVVEAQPLWEYPCKALAKEHEILSVIFGNFSDEKSTSGVAEIEECGSCNGIALWVDWNLDNSANPKSTVTTGPSQPIKVGKYIEWDMFVRQGVHLIAKPKQLTRDSSSFSWKVDFNPASGEIKFKFDVAT